MATPQPPASPRRQPPRLFLMDEHLRAMRTRSAQSQVPANSHAATRDNGAASSSAASVSPVSHATTSDKRKRTRVRLRKKDDNTPNEALPIALLPSPLYAVASAELPRRQTATAERDELAREGRELEARLELLRKEAGLPTEATMQALTEARDHNAAMDEMIHSNRQIVGQLQAFASQYLQLPPVNPLTTFIHLPCDKLQRCAILQAIKGVKIRRAAKDGIERFRDLEDSLSYLREERFTTDDGTYHCNRFEVGAFPQFKSARQMYDALLFWMHNLEISVTEMIDHVSLREDKDDMGPTIWNQRMISISQDVGCTEELNNVGFAQFFDSYDLMGGAPLGVIAVDTVDADDLHPYKPLERTRKDIHMYYLFSEYVDPVTKHKSVQLKMTLFNGQLAPKCPVEPHTLAKLHEYMSRWPVLMIQFLTNFIVPP